MLSPRLRVVPNPQDQAAQGKEPIPAGTIDFQGRRTIRTVPDLYSNVGSSRTLLPSTANFLLNLKVKKTRRPPN